MLQLESNEIVELLNDIASKCGERVREHINSRNFPYTYTYDFKILEDKHPQGMLLRIFSFLFKNYAEDFLFDILDENQGTEIKDFYNFIRINYVK